MMAPVHRIDARGASATEGRVRLDLKKLGWTGGLCLAGLALAPFYTTPAAVIFGMALTYITLLLGHSVGMHRMMIHKAFTAPKPLRYTLLYLGTLVGIGGPSTVIRIHDMRDWAQRAPECHDYFSHRSGYLRDLTWQLFYRFECTAPPRIVIEPEIAEDAFLRHLDRHWRWHQLGLAGLLFAGGGLPFVVWGVCLRVMISTAGHWTVTYICHNPGPGHWHVKDAGVQASDLKLPGRLGAWVGGVLTHGECWHSNHHAFPESARIGLQPGQVDPAGFIIDALARMGWVQNVGHPRSERGDLIRRDLTHSTPFSHSEIRGTSPVNGEQRWNLLSSFRARRSR